MEVKKIVVYNDNENHFQWIIHSFMKHLSMSQEQAEQCAMIIHNKGKHTVKQGTYEELHIITSKLLSCGINAVIF